MRRRIELVFDEACPNVDRARARLLEALNAVGYPAQWTEWERRDPGAPEYIRQFGSPSILIDGHDVGGAAPGDAGCCRVYLAENGTYAGVPSLASLLRALRGDPR